MIHIKPDCVNVMANRKDFPLQGAYIYDIVRKSPAIPTATKTPLTITTKSPSQHNKHLLNSPPSQTSNRKEKHRVGLYDRRSHEINGSKRPPIT